MCQSLKVEMEKFLIKKRKTTESTDTRTVPGKIKLVYSGLPHNGIRCAGLKSALRYKLISSSRGFFSIADISETREEA